MDHFRTPADCPPDSPLLLVDHLAEYMKARFNAAIAPSDPPTEPLPNIDIPTELLCEADLMVQGLSQAWGNRRIVHGFDPMREEQQVLRYFSNLQHEDPEKAADASNGYDVIEAPTILVNDRGYILAWYLPNLLSEVNQAQVWKSFELLRSTLQSSVGSSKETTAWRSDIRYFREGADLKGTINASPGWFQQGRNSASGKLDVSAAIRPGRNGGEGPRWLAAMTGTHALMSATMSIMHPEMYALGREAIIGLSKAALRDDNSEMTEVLRIWPSVYNSLSAMVNRCSPYHLDKNGKAQWFDQLLTVGDYSDLDLVFPRQELRMRYQPGTMVAFSGRLLVHGAGEVEGNRGCIAWYMQDKVHEALGVPRCNYARVSDLGAAAFNQCR